MSCRSVHFSLFNLITIAVGSLVFSCVVDFILYISGSQFSEFYSKMLPFVSRNMDFCAVSKLILRLSMSILGLLHMCVRELASSPCRLLEEEYLCFRCRIKINI